MNTKIRYDLDSLELANGDFGYPITEKEVRKVNRMLELISRQMCPTEGDSVEFVTRSGDYFGKAHIERITGKYADICLIPETVFCFDDMGKAAYDTTGSPWTQVNIRNMKPAGTEIRIFRTWGFGKRSNTGSLRFDAPVRKWEYREPNPLYDGYTTRNWFRYHIMKHRDRERTGEYTFRSDSFDIKEISREQWNGMGQHGQIRMKFMGYGPVRIHTDNENHTVTVYRINDSL